GLPPRAARVGERRAARAPRGRPLGGDRPPRPAPRPLPLPPRPRPLPPLPRADLPREAAGRGNPRGDRGGRAAPDRGEGRSRRPRLLRGGRAPAPRPSPGGVPG